jgi:hypothetical protein
MWGKLSSSEYDRGIRVLGQRQPGQWSLQACLDTSSARINSMQNMKSDNKALHHPNRADVAEADTRYFSGYTL